MTIWQKLLNLCVSMKFMAAVVSTWLFYESLLSENGWVMIILSVVGMREASKIAGAYAASKKGYPGKGAKK